MLKAILAVPTLALSVIALSACVPSTVSEDVDSASKADVVIVQGKVAYRERMALPPGSVVVVRVDDISRADAPATTIEEQRIVTTAQQVPIAFSIKVPRNQLPGPIGNTVSVRIEDQQGKLLWINDTITPIEPDEKYPVVDLGTIMLVKV